MVRREEVEWGEGSYGDPERVIYVVPEGIPVEIPQQAPVPVEQPQKAFRDDDIENRYYWDNWQEGQWPQ